MKNPAKTPIVASTLGTALGALLLAIPPATSALGAPIADLEISIRSGSEAGGLNVRSPHCPGDVFDFRTCEGVVVGSTDFGLFKVKLPKTFGAGFKSWRRDGKVWGYSWPYAQGITVEVTVEADGDSLKLNYTLQNTGSNVLDAVQLHTCIPTTEAPGFFPPPTIRNAQTNWSGLYERLHVWSGDRRVTFADTKLAASEPHLSLMRKGAPPVRWGWWVNSRETFDLPLIALASRDGQRTVALAFEQAVWASSNTGDDRACFHLFPWFGRIEPGQSVTVRGRLYVLRGGPQNALKRFQKDFPEVNSLAPDERATECAGHTGAVGGAQPHPSRPTEFPRPFRAAYLHLNKLLPLTSDPVEQEKVLTTELDRMKQFGLNALLPFVTTSSGKAHYESALLPESTYANSDPVRILAREARSRGIGFYPVVPVVICGDEQPAGILLRHPGWALRHPDGRAMGYISPAHPEARKWLTSVINEIVVKYQPEGIVLDYLRYANRPLRLDPAGEARFRKSLPANCPPADEKKLLQRFKESELTELVRLISETARVERPDFMLAAYCWGAHVAKNHQIAQIWPLWVERGYLDMVNISGYCHRETYGEKFLSVFEERISEARELNRQLPKPAMLTFALGVNTSHGRVHSAADIRSYLGIANRLKLDGVAYFTWEYLQPYVDQMKEGQN